MSVRREKVSEDKQVFIERVFDCFDEILDVCNSFFLNDAGKSYWVN